MERYADKSRKRVRGRQCCFKVGEVIIVAVINRSGDDKGNRGGKRNNSRGFLGLSRSSWTQFQLTYTAAAREERNWTNGLCNLKEEGGDAID